MFQQWLLSAILDRDLYASLALCFASPSEQAFLADASHAAFSAQAEASLDAFATSVTAPEQHEGAAISDFATSVFSDGQEEHSEAFAFATSVLFDAQQLVAPFISAFATSVVCFALHADACATSVTFAAEQLSALATLLEGQLSACAMDTAKNAEMMSSAADFIKLNFIVRFLVMLVDSCAVDRRFGFSY